MLWDIIRDFIVEHLTGGVTSSGNFYYCTLANTDIFVNGVYDSTEPLDSSTPFINLEGVGNISYGFGLGDWLATTITAVIIVLLVVFAVWLVRWIFKAVSSAFLLK